MKNLLAIAALLSPPVTETPPDLLAGPAVVAEEEPRTLVRRDFEGRLEPLDEEAGLAAIRLLGPDAGRMARIEAIVLDRQRHFDRIALENYATIAEIGGLLPTLSRGRPADDAEARRRARLVALLGDLSLEFVEFGKRGSLVDECATILTPDEVAGAKRLVAERMKAESEALAAANPGLTADEIERRARLDELGRRVRGSIERFAAGANAELERFRAELDLTPEQVETVRAVFGPIAIARLERDRDDRELRAEATRAFLAVYRTLDREQRAKFATMRYREAIGRERERDAKAAGQPPSAGTGTH
jgi:hypothetical protein